MGRKTSLVWNHFKIPEMFPKKAMCNYCTAMLGRGQKNMGTTSLMNHLKRCREFKVAMIAAHGPNYNEQSEESFNFFSDEGHLLKNLNETCSDNESNPLSTSDVEINPLSPSDNESSLPSLVVARRAHREHRQAMVQEYHSNGRPSLLLYGDINSAPNIGLHPEEPTTSDAAQATCVNPGPHNELMSYLSSGKNVNFVYGGFVLHMLYEQYKSGNFCDLQLVTQSQVSNEGTISETGKITRKNITPGSEKNTVKVHTSLLAAVSKKISVLVEMGCTSIQLKKGSYDAVRGLMEIVYTGKLGAIVNYTGRQLMDILEVAKFLEVEFATAYLLNETGGTGVKTKNRARKPSDGMREAAHMETTESNTMIRSLQNVFTSTPPREMRSKTEKRKLPTETLPLPTSHTVEERFHMVGRSSTNEEERQVAIGSPCVVHQRHSASPPPLFRPGDIDEPAPKHHKPDLTPDVWKIKSEPPYNDSSRNEVEEAGPDRMCFELTHDRVNPHMGHSESHPGVGQDETHPDMG